MATESPRRSPADLLSRLAGHARGKDPEQSKPADPEEPPEEKLDARDGIASAVADEPFDPDADLDYVPCGRGGVTAMRRAAERGGHEHLSELFDRVNSLLGDLSPNADEQFRPRQPESLQEAQLSEEDVERLVFKYLLLKGSATGREICFQIKLPYIMIEPLLKMWKQQQSIALKSAAEMGDYVFLITDIGRERARRYMEEGSYCGAAPVSLSDYLRAMAAQTIAGQEATEDDLRQAFSDLLIAPEMLERLGPAVNSGRGMFLFGFPGNGKTSIAERVTSCFGSHVWIPRALGIDGDVIRLFDPGVHDEVQAEEGEGLFDLSGVDQRWVRIVRPTIVAGGELTMAELEVTQNPQTKICEAPLQLKSNCGTLVIDDFGRQTMPVDVLLNRWIVPLEKRYDYLNLPSGKKVQVPFDQLIIFSTNLEPKDLVDGAFLRRIPYKIEVPDPSREHFKKLFSIMAPKLGVIYDDDAVEYLIDTHYVESGRPFRNCQPRDLLLQIRNFATYKKLPRRMTKEGFDFAVENYFSMM
ncbi:MAG: AAA family ATPase [Planctomycetaceae bacterium]|nr:AAA family ATPase [Planctomycetaceae bacterium]